MKDLLRKYHKYIVIFGIALLFMIFGSLYMVVRYNLPQTVRTILLEVVGADIESESITFKKGGLIEVRNVTLKNDDDLIVKAPLVEVYYKIPHLLKGRIDEIRVLEPTMWLTRYGDNKLNILDAFTDGDDKEEEDEDAPYVNEGSSVPIDRINIEDGYLYFTDLSYSKPIKKQAWDVSGYVAFSKKTGIDLSFDGNSEGIRGAEKLKFSYNDREHPYDLGIVLDNVSVDDDLLQYAYDGDDLTFMDGVVNLDMTLNPDAFGGRADFREVKASYEGLQTVVSDGSGEVNFAGKKIYIRGDYMLGDDPGKVLLEYKGDDGLDIDFYLQNILFEKLEAYDMLGELDLPVSDMLFERVHVNLAFDSNLDLKVNLDFYAPEYNMGGFEIKDLDGRLYYEGGENFYLKDVKFKGRYPNEVFPVEFLTKVDARLTEEEGELDYTIYDIDSDTNIERLSGSADLDFVKKVFSTDISSDLFSLYMDVDLQKELFTLRQSSKKDIEVNINDKKIKNRSELNFVYDMRDKFFLLGKGKIDLEMDDGLLVGDISTVKDNLKFERFRYSSGEGSASGSGEINLQDMSYGFEFKSAGLDFSQFLNEDELGLKADLQGKISGKGSDFEGNIHIKNLDGKYFLKFNNLEGDIYVKNDGVFSSYFTGYLGSLEYEGISFYDFQISAALNDNILSVRDFSNNISNIFGSYNIAEDKLDFKFMISDIAKRNLGDTDMYLDINALDGSVEGSLEDVVVRSNIEDVVVTLPKREETEGEKAGIATPQRQTLKISGGLEYSQGEVSLDRLKVNESLVSGNYSIETGLYSFKANLLEEDIPSYYGDINLKYRILGEVYLWGDKNSTKAYTRTTLDQAYLRGQRLPNLYIEGSFSGGKPQELMETGKLDLRRLVFLGDDGDELLEARAKVDLADKSIHLKNVTEKLDLSKLSYLGKDLTLEGSIDTSFEVEGSLEDMDYHLDLTSDRFKIGDIALDNLEVQFKGDLEGAELSEFNVEYEGNTLDAVGRIDLKQFEYYFDISSSEIDLEFLNVFLYPLGVEDLEGMSTIDLTLRNNNSSGSFIVKGFKASIPDYGIDIQNVDSDIKLDNEKVYVEKFQGDVNEGKVKVEGELDIPDFKRLKNELNPLEALNYTLKLNMDKVKYSYEDVIDLTMSSSLTMKNNKITGNFIVNRGEVKGIPDVSEKDVAKIKKKTRDAGDGAIAASADLGEDFAIETKTGSGFEVDVNLLIDEGIFINIEKVAPLVENLEAVIKGRGRLTLKNNRARFLGELNSEDGAVVINGNLFELDRVVLLFDEADEYFPNVNPTVMLNARSLIANEEVYILVTGKGEDLEIILSSNSGLSQEDIASLLAFHNTMDSSSSNVVVKNILDSQISRQLFNPVSSEIQRMLRISKFRISSDLTAYEYQDGQYEESSLGLGASIEAENPIYKNKVFWNATARVADNKEGDSIDEYDFIVEHRFAPNLSWGVGVGKLPEGRINRREDETANLNYHIDFKFRKRYNSITEIFIRK